MDMLQLYLSELSEYLEGRGKVILLCENARLHDTKPVTTYLTIVKCEVQSLSYEMDFFRRGIRFLHGRQKIVVESDGKYLIEFFLFLFNERNTTSNTKSKSFLLTSNLALRSTR